MNPDEIDVMKLTPEDYLKMRDRCKELERDNILQQEHILELEHANSELSATINRMHGGCERAIELRRLLDTLFDVGRDEAVSDDEILRRMKNLRDELTRLQKENVFLYHQRNQLRNDKKQQADCILKLETELSQFRVAMKESSEKIEVLNDSIDQLNKALADEAKGTKYWADEAHRAQKRIAEMIYKGDSKVSEIVKASADQIDVLNTSIAKLQDDCAKFASDLTKKEDEIRYWKNKHEQLKDTCSKQEADIRCHCMNTFAATLKDADAKIQSANDRAANAKKEAKEAKERAESASERVRYLERKLRDVGSLNDSLMKELANRHGALLQVVDKDADAYQRSVMRYAPSNIVNGSQLGFIYGVIGLCGEAGEASELVKKFVYHGHTLDYKHLAIELGDVLWYIAYTAYGLGYSLSNIMAINQEKLAKRYPDGKFDEERSRNREEGDI